MLVSGRVAEGEEALFDNDGEDLGDFEMHEQIDQWVPWWHWHWPVSEWQAFLWNSDDTVHMENTKALCIAGQKAVTLCVRYDLTHLKVNADMARGVAVAVDEFRDYLMERSIPILVDKVLDRVPLMFSWLMFRWQTSWSLGWRRRSSRGTARCTALKNSTRLQSESLYCQTIERSGQRQKINTFWYKSIRINHEMFLILKFVDVVFVPSLRNISMANRLPPVSEQVLKSSCNVD